MLVAQPVGVCKCLPAERYSTVCQIGFPLGAGEGQRCVCKSSVIHSSQELRIAGNLFDSLLQELTSSLEFVETELEATIGMVASRARPFTVQDRLIHLQIEGRH